MRDKVATTSNSFNRMLYSSGFYLLRPCSTIILPSFPPLQVLLVCPLLPRLPSHFRNLSHFRNCVLGAERTEQMRTPNNIQSWGLLPRYGLILQLPMPPLPGISYVAERRTGGKHAPPIIAWMMNPAPRFVCRPKPAIPRVNIVGKQRLLQL